MSPDAYALISSRGNIGPELSSICVDGAGTGGLLLIVAFALRRSSRKRRAAARADASFKPDAALVLGEAVIRGTVAREEGSDVAVRVEIEQAGSESESSGVWTHRWTELNRTVRVQPFYLLHASGERIRVDPGGDVQLVDTMDGTIRVDLTRRIRVAELVPGEAVFAVGELLRGHDPGAMPQGYRGRAEGYRLVAPRGEKMLLSSEPLGERFRRRAAFHLRWAAVALMTAIGFNTLFSPFHARRFWGETVDAEVTELQVYRDDDSYRYEVAVRVPEGFTFTDEVNYSDFSLLHVGDTIKARVVPWWPWANAIGPVAAADFEACFALPFVVALALAYRGRARSTRPWYDQAQFVETGSGKLEETMPKVAGKKPASSSEG